MRSLTAFAVVLAALSVPPVMAQTSSEPAAGAQEKVTPETGGSGGTAAQGETMPGTSGTGAAQPETETAVTDPTAAPAILNQQESDHQLAETYLGAKVVARSEEGLEDIGTVADLVLGPDDKIVGVVVDVGGFLGVGAKPVGLSWASLTQEQSEGELLLKTELTRQALEEAPEFKSLEDQQVESDQNMMEQAPATQQ